MLTNLFIFIVVCFMFVRANTLHHKGTTEILNVFVNNLYLLKSKTQIFLWKQSPRIYNTITFKMFTGFEFILLWKLYLFEAFMCSYFYFLRSIVCKNHRKINFHSNLSTIMNLTQNHNSFIPNAKQWHALITHGEIST